MTVVISFIMMTILVPLYVRLTKRFGLFDHPNERRINSVPIPTAGGLPIFIAFFIMALIYKVENLLPYFLGASFLTIVGLIDDYRSLSAGKKFVGQTVAVLLFVWFNPEQVSVLAILWMISVINVTNFIDGLDGLATGIIIIASTTLLIWTLDLGLYSVESLLFILIGTSLGFLVFNFNPAKVFLGDTGAMLLGFLYSALATNSVLTKASAVDYPALVIVLIVPVADTFCAIIRRLQKGVPFYQADQQHFHHRLLQLGLGHKQSVLFAYMLSLAAAGTALLVVKYEINQYFILISVAIAFLWGAAKIGMIRPLVVKSQRRVL